MYNNNMVAPMRKELTEVGVIELTTEDEVIAHLEDKKETQVIFVNSVCGCAAGAVRPGFIQSLTHEVKPSHAFSVFAGVDKEATNKSREYFLGYPPSSPAIAFMRDGMMVYFMERSQLEGATTESIRQFITSVYDKYFGETIRKDIKIKDPFAIEELTAAELQKTLKENNIALLDCRVASEREIASIANSQHVTQEVAENIIQTWDKKTTMVLYCHKGDISLQGARFFKQHGFTNISILQGGIDSWAKEIEKSMTTY